MAWILAARVSSGGTAAATTTGSATMAASTATTSAGNEWDDEESVPKCKESKDSTPFGGRLFHSPLKIGMLQR